MYYAAENGLYLCKCACHRPDVRPSGPTSPHCKCVVCPWCEMNVLSNLLNEHKLDCKIRTSVRILKEMNSNGVAVKIYLNGREVDSES
jgi:hypothetical protein